LTTARGRGCCVAHHTAAEQNSCIVDGWATHESEATREVSMPQYYCHQCAISNSLVRPASPSSLTDTPYKLCKFIKHTAPSASAVYSINSVFNDPTYQAYENYVVNATASGFLEIDYQGRKSIIWFAGSEIGVEYHNGVFVAPTDGVKLVLPEDVSRLHPFSIGSSPLKSTSCASCGRSIPFC
jgi:hypothetical protein